MSKKIIGPLAGTTMSPEKIAEKLKIAQMREQLDKIQSDMNYVAMDVKSVSNNVGTVEIGKTIDSVTVSWVLNKTPTIQMVNGNTVAVDDRSVVIPGPFTSGQSFVVKATDERGKSDSGTTAINFVNGVYYGVLEDGQAIDSAAVLGLTRELQSEKGITFTANAGENQRLAYALPSRYGTPKFVIGGFEYEWTKTTISFTNSSGYTEQYDIWRHGQLGGGNLTVSVS